MKNRFARLELVTVYVDGPYWSVSLLTLWTDTASQWWSLFRVGHYMVPEKFMNVRMVELFGKRFEWHQEVIDGRR